MNYSNTITAIPFERIGSPLPESLQITNLFHNKRVLLELEFPKAAIPLPKIVNHINYVHFMNESIMLHFHDPEGKVDFLAEARPEPCMGDELSCRLRDPFLVARIGPYRLEHLLINKDQAIVFVPVILKGTTDGLLNLKLPEEGCSLSLRESQRSRCMEISAELVQSGFSARGQMLDFNSRAFRIKVTADPSCSFTWLNSEEETTIRLYRNQTAFFSGSCRIIRQTRETEGKEIVLEPISNQISRFKKKKMRNPRQKLTPPASISFVHPFSQKRIQREIYDISNSGFAVCESPKDDVLFPGMVIHGLVISYAGFLKITCTAQVVRREQKEDGTLYGCSILDMDVENYSKLTHLVNNSIDPYSHISNVVDMEALWEFFFDTNFIYPQKYKIIQKSNAELKETFRRLYEEAPEISKHFTYEKNGRIYAHISLLKVYSRSWMVHHLAARSMDGRLAGLNIMKQIMHYLNTLARHPSTRTDFAICYYRPENEFSDRAFGGFARDLNDLLGCSLDLFSYMPFAREKKNACLPEDFSLDESSASDLWELEKFYSATSGGLLIEALGLRKQDMIDSYLEKSYRDAGFLRSCKVYSLRHHDKLMAVLIVNRSEVGVNFSELMNCIKIIVINPDLNWEILSMAAQSVMAGYTVPEIPVLIYPGDYLQSHNGSEGKKYQFWVLDLREHDADYVEYMARRFRVRFK